MDIMTPTGALMMLYAIICVVGGIVGYLIGWNVADKRNLLKKLGE